ncbi:MAG: hypothetical protein ACYS0D_05445 [Planctomycetota bacterium]
MGEHRADGQEDRHLAVAQTDHFWESNTITGIGSLQANPFHSAAEDVNDGDMVVGRSQTPGGWEAVLWTQSNGLQGLGFVGGCNGGTAFQSRAAAINNAGEITGHTSTTTRCAEAFIWAGGSYQQTLGVLNAQGTSQGTDINDANPVQVVGRASDQNNQTKAFLWDQNSGMVALQVLTSYVDCDAYGLNDDGDVVGDCRDGAPREATLWLDSTGHTPQGLGFLDNTHTRSRATDINNRGQVVGFSEDPPFIALAYIWDACNGMRDLNLLVDASGAGWTLREALAINDAGQIVGHGTNPASEQEGYLLTPITGACCDATGFPGCSIQTEADCDCLGGTYLGDNLPCNPDPCSGGVGACCYAVPPLCTVTTAPDCVLLGGTYLGDNVPCIPDPCVIATGACCVPIFGTPLFQCLDLTAADCAGLGGTYMGDGVPCTPWPCPGSPTGACCIDDGSGGLVCVVTTVADCIAQSGNYRGDAVPCVPDPCDCPSDLNGDGMVGTADLLQLLSVWGFCPGCPEDLNGDQFVGTADLLILLSDWGPC